MRYTRHLPTAFGNPSTILSSSLLVFSSLASLGTSLSLSLPVCATAWSLVWILCTIRSGRPALPLAHPQLLACSAGVLLAVAQLCEHAAEHDSGWWAKALLLPMICLCTRSNILYDVAVPDDLMPAESQPFALSASPTRRLWISGSTTSIMLWSGLALHILRAGPRTNAVVALGLSYAVVEAFALCIVKKALDAANKASAQSEQTKSSPMHGVSAASREPLHFGNSYLTVCRDVSWAAAMTMWLSVAITRSGQSTNNTGWHLLDNSGSVEESAGHIGSTGFYTLTLILIHFTTNITLLLTVNTYAADFAGATLTSAAIIVKMICKPTLARLWAVSLYAGCSYFLIDGVKFTIKSGPIKLGGHTLLKAAASLTLLGFFLIEIRHSFLVASPRTAPSISFQRPEDQSHAQNLAPMQLLDLGVHPIQQLMQGAQTSWDKKVKSQSSTLGQAIREYRLRYGMHPPPNFDKWFDFAKSRGVQLIDEYDTIYDLLLPFWALKPATVRARAKEAIGYQRNVLMGILIRDGKVSVVENGEEWIQQALAGMLESFTRFLPDMDLAFNLADEPRVIVPHDELVRLVQAALEGDVATASQISTPRNRFSSRPKDVDAGKRIAETKVSRFSQFALQPSWILSRMSCPLESPARVLEEAYAADNLTAYALSDLGFLYNQTAYADICNTPSFAASHGFFDRPNFFSITNELVPVFSQSKISSYQDITYPSPWYWSEKVKYEASKDPDWSEKKNKLWWRGSTTGAFSRAGGWKRHHRQQFVRKVNAPDVARILEKSSTQSDTGRLPPQWTIKEAPRQDYSKLMDVHFSGVGQCDPGDCDAQKEFFHIKGTAQQSDAWSYKYLLDLDGNAFSGRFYAFLRSRSLTFKMAVFREWHSEWIQPWVHYIPLSLHADEALEAVRYLDEEIEGRPEAMRIAAASADWAKKALRNEDLEVWFFRLLLEYARVIDDDRAVLGFGGP